MKYTLVTNTSGLYSFLSLPDCSAERAIIQTATQTLKPFVDFLLKLALYLCWALQILLAACQLPSECQWDGQLLPVGMMGVRWSLSGGSQVNPKHYKVWLLSAIHVGHSSNPTRFQAGMDPNWSPKLAVCFLSTVFKVWLNLFAIPRRMVCCRIEYVHTSFIQCDRRFVHLLESRASGISKNGTTSSTNT